MEAGRHQALISSGIVPRIHSHQREFHPLLLPRALSRLQTPTLCTPLTLTAAQGCTHTHKHTWLRLIDSWIFFSRRCGSTTAECGVNGPAPRLLRHHWAAIICVTLCHVHLDRSLTIQTTRCHSLELIGFSGDWTQYTTWAYCTIAPCCKSALKRNMTQLL